MIIRHLTDKLSVADQLVLSDLEAIAKAGFKSVICNRPDEESELHDKADALAKHAAYFGLEFRYQPVNSAVITNEDVTIHAELISEIPGPVLTYCRSGTRCTKLWALTQKGEQPAEQIVNTAAQAGINIFDIVHLL